MKSGSSSPRPEITSPRGRRAARRQAGQRGAESIFAEAAEAARAVLPRLDDQRRRRAREPRGGRVDVLHLDLPRRSAEGAQDVLERGGEQFVRGLAGCLAAQPAPGGGAVEPGPALEAWRSRGESSAMSAWKAASCATARRTRSATTRLTSGSAMSSPCAIVASQIVRLASVQSSQRDTESATRARALRPRAAAAAPRAGRRAVRAADVDLLASAEVVVHEPAGDPGGARDVLDRDLVVGALGEQRVGCVEDLLAPLPGAEAAVPGEFITPD